MRILLDTHAFLWFISVSPNLSSPARQLIEDSRNERLISIASLWEMSIKASLGKLKLNLSFPDMVETHVIGNAMKLLPVLPEHLAVCQINAVSSQRPV